MLVRRTSKVTTHQTYSRESQLGKYGFMNLSLGFDCCAVDCPKAAFES
jgi:hypothetical protein